MSLVTSVIDSIWQYASLMLFQSTLLITGGLFTVNLLRLRDAAMLSLIYRCILFAVFVAPIATLTMLQSDIRGWWPRHWSEQLSTSLDSTRRLAGATEEPQIPFETPTPLVSATPQFPADATTQEVVATVLNSSGTLASSPHFFPTKPELAEEINSTFFMKSILLMAWGGISTLLLIRLCQTHTRLRRALSKAVPAEHSIQAFCDQIAMEMNVKSPRVVISPYFSSPFVAGIFDPVLHLSSEGVGDHRPNVHPSEFRDIFVHELAHLKRHDVKMRQLNQLVLAIFFFQPLLWWLNQKIEECAEDVCDDYAMSMGASREGYARRLLDLAERYDFPLGSAVGIASGRSMLAHRVTRIMDHSRKLSIGVRRIHLATCGIFTSIAVSGLCLMMTPSSHAVAAFATAQVGAPEHEPSASLPSMQRVPQAKVQSKDNWPQDAVTGTVLGDAGPIAGAEVYWYRTRVNDLEPMTPVRVLTDANGKFEIKRTPPNTDAPGLWDMREGMLVRAKACASELVSPVRFGATIPFDPDFPGDHRQLPSSGVPLILAGEGPSIAGTLIDRDGLPIEGASVRILWFSKEPNSAARSVSIDENGVSVFFSVPRDRTESDWMNAVNSVVQVPETLPLRTALPMATTDHEGKFQLTELPVESICKLLIERSGIQSTEIVVRNYGGDEVMIVPQLERYTHDLPTTLYPKEFLATIGPSLAVAGTVTDAETGLPIPGVMVRTDMVDGSNLRTSWYREHLAAKTDSQGRYRIDGLPIGKGNNLMVYAFGDTPYMPMSSAADTSVPDTLRLDQKTLDFQLKKGIWAEGRVYDPVTNEPFQGTLSYFWFRNQSLAESYPGRKVIPSDGLYVTDSDGHYRIPIFPFAGIIAFSTGNRDLKRMSVYPRGYGKNELARYQVPQQNVPLYATDPIVIMADHFNRLALIEPKPGEQIVHVDMPYSASKPISVRIQSPNGVSPPEQIEFYGGSDKWGWQVKRTEELIVEDLLPNEKRKVFAFDRERNLAGGTVVEHVDGKTFEIQLAQAGIIKGRLIDVDGVPVTDATLTQLYNMLDMEDGALPMELGKEPRREALPIDDEGRFEIHGVSAGWNYSSSISPKIQGDWSYPPPVFEGVQIQPGETRDLGDIVIKRQ